MEMCEKHQELLFKQENWNTLMEKGYLRQVMEGWFEHRSINKTCIETGKKRSMCWIVDLNKSVDIQSLSKVEDPQAPAGSLAVHLYLWLVFSLFI